MSLRTPLFVAVSVAAAFALSACTVPSVGPSATPTPTETVPTATALALQPDGTAFDNKEYFDSVLRPVAEEGHTAPGRAMVTALVDAGFIRGHIEVSPDHTRTGLEADSVFVSVRMGKLCLIGQRTNDKELFTSVESALKIGKCLVGNNPK